MLARGRHRFELACRDQLRLDDCEPNAVNVPWTDVVFACVDHSLARLNSRLLAEVAANGELISPTRTELAVTDDIFVLIGK